MPTFGGIVVATGSEASGRVTLLDVANELARTVNASDPTTLALAKDAIRSAIRVMNRKGCWPWEYQEEDVAITSNNKFSTVASAIKKPLSMHLLVSAGGTEDQRLAYVPYDIFREKYNMNVSSDPLYYTIPNLFETGQIRWYPTPSANDNARFAFWRVTPAPRAEDEVIEVPEYAFEAYMSRAWYEFAKRLPNNQRPMPIQFAAAEASVAFRELSSHVTSSGDSSRFLDVY